MVKFFGTTIKETLDSFKSKKIHLGESDSKSMKDDRIKSIGRIVVTLLLFGFAVYLITQGNSKDLGNTIIGGIIGYWLK